MDKNKTYKAWMETATSSLVLLMAIAALSENRMAIVISSIMLVLSCVTNLVLYKKWGPLDKSERPFLAKVINFIAIILLSLNLIMGISSP